MPETDPIVIVAAKRTPMGAMQGIYQDVPAAQLGAHVIQALLTQTQIDPNLVESVMMGCVLMAGQGQAPARQAALGAGLGEHTTCNTLNKMCGSGLEAVAMAHDFIKAGRHEIMIAGGLENMTRAPYLLSKARSGYRLGHAQMFDHMFLDGLQDAYSQALMGECADATARELRISREEQDAFAVRSLELAQAAVKNGLFKAEIEPINIPDKKETRRIEDDEVPMKFKAEKIPTLKPAFGAEGTVTAANSSAIADGAAAVMLMRASKAKALGLKAMAKIVGHHTIAQAPEWFTTAPALAVEQLLQKINWTTDDVDLFEINEAFAVVTLAAMQKLKLKQEKVNIHGGACALGHPIGASGARILTTLLHAMQEKNVTHGIATLCIGGGEATALAIERG